MIWLLGPGSLLTQPELYVVLVGQKLLVNRNASAQFRNTDFTALEHSQNAQGRHAGRHSSLSGHWQAAVTLPSPTWNLKGLLFIILESSLVVERSSAYIDNQADSAWPSVWVTVRELRTFSPRKIKILLSSSSSSTRYGEQQRARRIQVERILKFPCHCESESY